MLTWATQKYLKQAAEDRERYAREYREVYGEDPDFVVRSKAKAKVNA